MLKNNIYLPAGILVFMLLISLLAPLIAPYDPEALHMDQVFLPFSREHLLGTDDMGRDIFSRLLYGGRVSIMLAFIATLIASVIGLVVGTAAGFYGDKIDLVVTGVSSIFQGLPGTTMLIALTGVLGPGISSLLIAIPLTSWVGFSRIIRGEVMRIRDAYYIEAVKSLGAGDFRIILRHILPNIMESVIILFTNRIGNVVLSVSSLSYLGFGLQPPVSDWGLMINASRLYYESMPVMVWGPGVCIMLFVFSVHSIGNWLRDRLDAKSRESVEL